jgi:hypothetical protein
MQAVSATFAPYAVERVCDMRVVFELVDVDAAATAVPDCSDSCSLAQLEQTHDGVLEITKKYATFEWDFWRLDGSFPLPEEDLTGTQTGWWSGEISNFNGAFAAPPVLSFSFPHNQSSVGFTIYFDASANQYPTVFRVVTFDLTGEIVTSLDVENQEAKCIINLPTENYRRVEFQFQKTSEPYRRVRVCEVVFGIVQYFDRSNLSGGALTYELSPISASLPSSELSITIDNSRHAYNLINPKGLYAYLQQAQPLDAYLGINGEYVSMGRFYFTTAEAEDSSMTAKITAHDRVYWFEKAMYRSGSTGQWTLAEAVSQVLIACNFDVEVVMPEKISGRAVGKALPECTCREALRLLAQAARCTCYIDRNDRLVFAEPEISVPADTLDNDNMSVVAKIKVSEQINAVELTVKDEYAQTQTVYRAENIAVDEQEHVAAYSNAVAADGQAVANWLLSMAQRRLTYTLDERGNPAREIGDTAVIYDAYGENRPAMIFKEAYGFNGGLSCDTQAVG